MPVFISPTGNPELWEEQPPGYMTEEEYYAANPSTCDLALSDLLTSKLRKVANNRKQAQTSGFTVNDITFDSDDPARLAYMELSTRFQTDPDYTVRWKASEGTWVDMNATLFEAVMVAGEQHLTTCFAWQETKELELKTCKTVAELEAISITFDE